MSYRFLLLIIALTAFCGACSLADKKNAGAAAGKEEIVFDDLNKTNNLKEIIFDDMSLKELNAVVNTSFKSIREEMKHKADGSQVTTMYDGFGNKTETRFFSENSRLKCIIVRTAANGQKQTFVYGGGGEIKDLPADLIDRALTASAGEIADATGIYQTFKEAPKLVTVRQEQPSSVQFSNNSFPPPVNNDSAIQNQTPEQPVPQDIQTPEQITKTAETPPSKPQEQSKNFDKIREYKEQIERTQADKKSDEKKQIPN